MLGEFHVLIHTYFFHYLIVLIEKSNAAPPHRRGIHIDYNRIVPDLRNKALCVPLSSLIFSIR